MSNSRDLTNKEISQSYSDLVQTDGDLYYDGLGNILIFDGGSVTGGNIMQVKRDTASDWTAANPVLSDGEIGYEWDTRKLKFGDGTTPWIALPYYGGGGGGGFTPIYAEVPSGTIDGVNNTFMFSNVPLANTVRLFLNGLRLMQGEDYSVSLATITMSTIPYPGDILMGDYDI